MNVFRPKFKPFIGSENAKEKKKGNGELGKKVLKRKKILFLREKDSMIVSAVTLGTPSYKGEKKWESNVFFFGLRPGHRERDFND